MSSARRRGTSLLGIPENLFRPPRQGVDDIEFTNKVVLVVPAKLKAHAPTLTVPSALGERRDRDSRRIVAQRTDTSAAAAAARVHVRVVGSGS